jgi:hypothetical protein
MVPVGTNDGDLQKEARPAVKKRRHFTRHERLLDLAPESPSSESFASSQVPSFRYLSPACIANRRSYRKSAGAMANPPGRTLANCASVLLFFWGIGSRPLMEVFRMIRLPSQQLEHHIETKLFPSRMNQLLDQRDDEISS